MNFYLILFSLSAILFNTNLLQGQFLCNKGGQISIKSNTSLYVKGSFIHEHKSKISNKSVIYVTQNWTNNNNDSVFLPLNKGTVILAGNTQKINGSTNSTFDTLKLYNGGIKHANRDITVLGTLDLDTAALHLNDGFLFLNNPDSNALQFGFNNDIYGRIQHNSPYAVVKHMGANTALLIPFYDSLEQKASVAYIKNALSDTTSLHLQFYANNPDNAGFLRDNKTDSICFINNRYSFLITNYGSPNKIIGGILTNSKDSVSYNGLSYNTFDVPQWQHLATAPTTSLISANDLLKGIRPIDIADSIFLSLAQLSPVLELPFGDSSLCNNESLPFLVSNSINYKFDNYAVFLNNEEDTIYSVDSFNWSSNLNGTFSLLVKANNNACTASTKPIDIELWPSVKLVHTGDTSVLRNKPVNIWAAGADFIKWLPDDGSIDCNTCPISVINLNEGKTLKVTGESLDGCTDTASVNINVYDDLNTLLHVPNIITPNADGKNDSWVIKNLQLFPNHRIVIINRWGSTIYETSNYQNTFDGTFAGKPIPDGTYFYIIDTKSGLGTIKGDLTIVR